MESVNLIPSQDNWSEKPLLPLFAEKNDIGRMSLLQAALISFPLFRGRFFGDV
jgi:hypothetical protein